MKQIIALWTAFCCVAIFAEEPKPDAEGWVSLLNSKDTTGWRLRHGNKSSWSVTDGVLKNDPKGHGVDLISEVPIGDCELHVEFMVPKGSNSGVYLQGRYEIQVDDSFGMPADSHHTGGIYNKITPKSNASKPAGEWQSFDVVFRQAGLDDASKVLKKARVSVIHNGQKIIEDAEIDGPTGSAVDTEEGKPAGLMLQGDHGIVSYRNIKMRPIKTESKPAAAR